MKCKLCNRDQQKEICEYCKAELILQEVMGKTKESKDPELNKLGQRILK